MNSRMLLISPALAVGLLVGCSSDGGTGDTPSADGSDSDAESLVACSEVFSEGAQLSADDAAVSCALADGTTASGTVAECVDGRVLITFEGSDPQLWGFVDEPLQAASTGALSTSPEVAEFTDLC